MRVAARANERAPLAAADSPSEGAGWSEIDTVLVTADGRELPATTGLDLRCVPD